VRLNETSTLGWLPESRTNAEPRSYPVAERNRFGGHEAERCANSGRNDHVHDSRPNPGAFVLCDDERAVTARRSTHEWRMKEHKSRGICAAQSEMQGHDKALANGAHLASAAGMLFPSSCHKSHPARIPCLRRGRKFRAGKRANGCEAVRETLIAKRSDRHFFKPLCAPGLRCRKVDKSISPPSSPVPRGRSAGKRRGVQRNSHRGTSRQ